MNIIQQPANVASPWGNTTAEWTTPRQAGNRRLRNLNRPSPAPTAVVYPQAAGVMSWTQPWGETISLQSQGPQFSSLAPITSLAVSVKYFLMSLYGSLFICLQPDVLETKLSTLSMDGVCKLLKKVEDMNSASLQQYTDVIKQNNVNGKVLLHCDLEELKKVRVVYYFFSLFV